MKPVVQEDTTETVGLRTRTGSAQPSFRLTVTQGPDASKTFVVDGSAPSRVLVGTGPTCHWLLSDHGVSRRHLALSLRDGSLDLEDLASTNGTFVGSLRVRAVSLSGGEDIFLSSSRIVVERLAQNAQAVVARVASFGRLLGASVAMRRLYPTLARLAVSDVPMLIEGESGTGKELLAEAIHEEGPRSQGELLVFDASTGGDRAGEILFGLAGAPGLIERCRGGTLVIDEPSELPANVQTTFTRFLEKRPVMRADGTELAPCDARIIALSRSDIEREVQGGRLRDELAAVLGAARVELPPVRDRAGDVTLLATAFFRELRIEDRVLSPMTVRRFEAYSWPGNVRELKNAVARYATTGDDTADARSTFRAEGDRNSPDELYQRVFAANLPLSQSREIIVEDFDRRFVRRILERHGGNVSRAAAASGLARRYFQILRVKRGA
jgi:DNA-binding NtrC family response regulator